ncbi:cyclin-U1-1-like [Chenopodium quinoa]|uniref:Cyclin n=1 Tax=Chenopodium quinoa TaxID=63459 RepID=A0A803MDN6_CHEQI|nr:cyclin-U1-1-like [Chenopodium quinoa]
MLATIPSEDHVGGQQPETSAAEATTPRVLLILAAILERLVTRNDPLIEHNGRNNLIHYVSPRPLAAGELGMSLKVFNGVRAPNISIAKYLERLFKYTNCSPSCFVVGYVYIDRLVHKHPELLVISLNVHRLLLTSVMIASKMLDDVQYNNAFYAKVGGVSNSELNRLELELLFLLNFEVTVSSPIFQSYCWYLEKEDLRIGSTLKRVQQPLAFDIKDDVNGI